MPRPQVPLVFRGKFDSPERLQKCLETWKAEKSAVGADVEAEGLLATSSAKWMICVGHGAAWGSYGWVSCVCR